MFFELAEGSRRIAMSGNLWQPEEDEKLLELLANGKTWKEISLALPGRSEGSCSHHFRNTLLNQLLEDPVSQQVARLYNR